MNMMSYTFQMTAAIIGCLAGLVLGLLLLLGKGPSKFDPALWISSGLILLISTIGLVRAIRSRRSE